MSFAGKEYSPLLASFYPAFDGLRAIAFLMVFLVHYGTVVWSAPLLKWGWMGVDLFFVLSGFLITGILYDSIGSERFLKNFYVRRALRILPLLLAAWGAIVVATPFLHVVWNRYNVAMALFCGNNFMAAGDVGRHAAPGNVMYFSHHHHGEPAMLSMRSLWSLCLEEQFYFVWPLVVLMVKNRKALLSICLACIAIVPLARALYANYQPALTDAGGLYFSTWSRVDTLLVGAALALWLRGPAPAVATLRKAARGVMVATPLALTAVYLATRQANVETWSQAGVGVAGFSIIAMGAAGVVISAMDPATMLYRWLQWRPLQWVGRRSYGLYVFHGIPASYFYVKAPLLMARHLGFVIPLGALAYTVLAGAISFRLVESPALRLKNLWAYERGRIADPPPVGANVRMPRQHGYARIGRAA